MKTPIAGVLCAVVLCVSCSDNSTAPKASLPDLVIEKIAYAHKPGPIAGMISDTLFIRNIGQADFYGLLYVSQASEKYYRRTGLFSSSTLIYCDWASDSLGPARITPGQTIIAKSGSFIPQDTSVVRFHIQTDTTGIPAGTLPLPVYAESNYDNNDYLLIIQ